MLSIRPLKVHADTPIAPSQLSSGIIQRTPTTSIQKEDLSSVEGRTRMK
jgi:hypothetical protein